MWFGAVLLAKKQKNIVNFNHFLFIVVRITFIYFNQIFEFNKAGVKLVEYNRISLIRHLGFVTSQCLKTIYM